MRRRYRQVRQEDGSYAMVEIGTDVVARHGIVVGDFQPYRSPIDGTMVTSERQHDDHKRKHGVVEHREFGTQHWEDAEKRRERVFTGKPTEQETLRRKQETWELINRMERG